MTELKLYEKLTAIRLKDDRIITTEASVQEVAKMLNSSDFVVIGELGFNKFEVKNFKEFNPTQMDCFIYAQPSPKKERLTQIMEERKEKNFKTKSIDHLLAIYDSKYLE